MSTEITPSFAQIAKYIANTFNIDTYYNIYSRYTARNTFKSFVLQKITNPFVYQCCNDNNTPEIEDNPVLSITLTQLQKLIIRRNDEMHIRYIINEFIDKTKQYWATWNTNKDIFIHAAVVYFLSLIIAWLSCYDADIAFNKPNLKHNCEVLQLVYAHELVKLIYEDLTEFNKYPNIQDLITEYLCEEIFIALRIHGTFGLETKVLLESTNNKNDPIF